LSAAFIRSAIILASLTAIIGRMDWRDDPVGSAHRGENPMVIARMRSGFAVIGDTQHLPGYSLLLCENPTVDHLTDLPLARRQAFLLDMALLGEAVERACHPRRINYEVLGNSLPLLHAHVHPRYEWEPAELIGGPVWRYPDAVRAEHPYSDEEHGELRATIRSELERVMRAAY
jgi:diadenosine tetraphosphate (Ap4A) HIT family hydrolase